MAELYQLTAFQLRQLLKEKKTSSLEIVQSVFKRIKQTEPKISAFVNLCEEESYNQAKEVDIHISQNKGLNTLTGIPIAIKDNICTTSLPTTCSSRILENFYPPYEATVIKKIKKAGAIIIGKTNLDEFAMGSSTENSAFGPTHNPWDLNKVPGGSSGGSAASVAALETILALGTDTGGSIRQPAAFCGITGLKPTYGLVSRYGLVAFASSLDQIGPLTKNVADSAILLNTIAGFDEKDSTSIKTNLPDYTKALDESIKGLKIGLAHQFFTKGLDPVIHENIKKQITLFESLGAKFVDVNLPTLSYALASYYIIAPAEASSNLARYDGARYGYRDKASVDINSMFKKTRESGFGSEVKRRIIIGTYVLSAGYYQAYYLKAQKIRTLIKNDFNEAFKSCDVILTPATPTLPFKLGENISDPLKMYLSDIYTVAINLAGLPAIVLGCGFHQNLPIGLQLIGRSLDEYTLIKLASCFQKNTDYHLKKPLF